MSLATAPSDRWSIVLGIVAISVGVQFGFLFGMFARSMIADAEARAARHVAFVKHLRSDRARQTTTADGTVVHLCGNVELPAEALLALDHGADVLGEEPQRVAVVLPEGVGVVDAVDVEHAHAERVDALHLGRFHADAHQRYPLHGAIHAECDDHDQQAAGEAERVLPIAMYVDAIPDNLFVSVIGG